MIADDLGVDKVPLYTPGDGVPPMPNLERLAARGVVFERAYVNPTCAPTRASLLTGRWPSRTGVGSGVLPPTRRGALPLDEVTLPERLRAGTGGAYATAAVGKWHLGDRSVGGARSPLRQGFDHHVGPLGNLHDFEAFDGARQTYDDWERAEDGVVARSAVYVTVNNVREASRFVATLPEPWLVWVAFSAPHEPFHIPPETVAPTSEALAPWEQYDALVRSVDTALGRIVRAIPDDRRDRTTVVFLGDNGTPPPAVRPPFPSRRSKGTVFEGGIHVPLVVSGHGVSDPGRRTAALVHAVDLLPTLLALAGVPAETTGPPRIDGQSFAGLLADPEAPPPRTHALSEWFEPNGATQPERRQLAVYDGTHKLVRDDDGEALYRLGPDGLEGPDLLAAPRSPEADRLRDRLRAALTDLQGR